MIGSIFILGAGASKQAGGPLMADFLDEATRIWREGRSGEYEENFQSVFRAIGRLQAVHSKSELDITNIESVFGTLEMARTLNCLPGTNPTEIPDLIRSLKLVIVRTLESSIKLPASGGHVSPPEPYAEFAELISDLTSSAKPAHSVGVISFNYDMALDYTFHHETLGYDYGLSQSASGIPFYKLHGSLNWALCPQCQCVVAWDLRRYFGKYSWRNLYDTSWTTLPIGSHLKHFGHCKDTSVDPDPILVPPTWNKSEHQVVLAPVWSKAAQLLSRAENIFVIGYSLPESDYFFRQLYALGTVGDQPLKRIWVFNPDTSGMVQQRFADLLGPGAKARYRFLGETFEESIRTLRKEFNLDRGSLAVW